MNPKIKAITTETNLEGRYVNYFKVGYNSDVFVIDYYQLFSENKESECHLQSSDDIKLRMITSPADAHELQKLLGAAIDKYEDNYGKIQD